MLDVFLYCFPSFEEIVSHWMWGSLIGWIGWPENPLDHPISTSWPPGSYFYGFWWSQIGSSCLCGKHFTHWAVSLATGLKILHPPASAFWMWDSRLSPPCFWCWALLLSTPDLLLSTPGPLPTLEFTESEEAWRASTYSRNTKILPEWVTGQRPPHELLLALLAALAASCLAMVSLPK